MAEEWGIVIFKASDEVSKEFTSSNSMNGLKILSDSNGLKLQNIESKNLSIEGATLKKGYVCFSFDCSDWLEISQAIVKSGDKIEWYARISDEYGCIYFYALNSDGEKLGFSVETGGDYCEIEGYEEESEEKIENWKLKVPKIVKSTFPDMFDTEDIRFDMP